LKKRREIGMSICERAVVQMMNYGMSRAKAEEIVRSVIEERDREQKEQNERSDG
jgi:hypothetical protein